MIIRGATAHIGFRLSTKTGPMVLTGAQVDFLFRRNEFTATETRSCTVSEQDAGAATVILTPEDTAEAGNYYYQLRVTFPDQTVIKSELALIVVEEGL